MSNYTIKTDKLPLRLLYFFTSMIGVAIGIAFVLKANIGGDPLNVMFQGLTTTLGFTLGTWVTVVWLGFMLLAMMLGVKPYIATILDLLLFGSILDFVVGMIKVPDPTSMIMSLGYLAIGMLFMTFFVAVYLNSNLGAGPTMLFVYAVSGKTEKSIGLVKTLFDIVILIVGFLLGGVVGVGTLILAITVGYAIEFFTKKIKLVGISN